MWPSSTSFVADGRKINVGDCALFKPPHKSLPFVGRIRKLKLGKENNISLCVNWLYRPVDVKLKEGASLEAAPNEIFYSNHKDEIPAASLLHPCKVTFLRKGVELPSGISSFVCRQVYDVENECLFWLTDRNYINSFLTQELQEEVDQLLDKTLTEMDGAVQTGGWSPKPLNSPNGSAQRKPSSANVHNSSSPSSHAKSKKRVPGVRNSESVKCDRLSKVDDADSGQVRPEHILKTQIAKISDKRGLVDSAAVEKLIQLMRPESPDKKLDLVCRTMLVNVISSTDRSDHLGQFVHLKGLLVLDEWLQEIHKGKITGGSRKEKDKSVEDFLFSLLCALEKLPVNLHALQNCNVGKSVNHLRSHKNSEIQKKARNLVSTWRRRVEAEMNIIEKKSSTSQGISWPKKPMVSEVSPKGGSRCIGGSYEVGPKSSTLQPPALKSPKPKDRSDEAVTKSPTSPTTPKLSSSFAAKERSRSPSQSPNNSQSCSSNHAKTGPLNVCKISSSFTNGKNSSNGFHGSTVPGTQKQGDKVGYVNRNFVSEKGSPTGETTERVSDVSHIGNGNATRLIVRLPNTGGSTTQTTSTELPENFSKLSGKDSLPVPYAKKDQNVIGKNDSLQGNTDMGNDLSQGRGLIVPDEDQGKKDASFGSSSSPGVTPKPGKLCEPSYSSINALVESCAKLSEASVTPSIGDDGGINLLASVAAGEMLRSDVSPACSPQCNTPVPEGLCSANAAKLRQRGHDGGHIEDNCSVANDHVMVEQVGSMREDGSNMGSVDTVPEVKPAGLIEDTTNMKLNSSNPLEEANYPDDETIRNTVGRFNAAATSVKPEATQIKEESVFQSSLDMHEDEKKLVHNRLTNQRVATPSCGDVGLAPKSEETDEKAPEIRDSMTSVGEYAYENMKKDDKGHVVAMQEVRTCGMATDVTEGNRAEGRTIKLDFDLNEVLHSDDGIQCEAEKTAVHATSPLASNNKDRSGLLIVAAAAAAAKGPLYPSESLIRGNSELGLKGSDTTSAFHPAKLRKADVLAHDSCTSKLTNAVFKFDLNVGIDDDDQHNAPSGFDLDLNACEVTPPAVQLSVSTSSRPSRSGLPSGPDFSRGFDLNGPGMEGVGSGTVSSFKNGMPFISGSPNVSMNSMDMGNFPTCFPPDSAYPAITIPSQRILTPVASCTSSNPEIFRGAVLSSSPAVAFPSNVPFQYSAFPFETSFSVPSISNTFASVSNVYADSSPSSGGPLCFSAIPTVGPNGMVSMPYRPYLMSVPGGLSIAGPDGRTWGSQGLELNTGPGDKLGTTLRQLQLPVGGGNEQLRMFHQMAAGGGASKRKEPDGGWDGDNRISYKHTHQQ